VKYDREQGTYDGGRLGVPSSRCVVFDDLRSVTVGGLAPGRFRFKVFPLEIAIEPEWVTITDDHSSPVEIRWRRVE
jgi:hypothetical protein